MKGIFEFEISGQPRGFKFGTYAFSIACERDGNCDLNELFKRCGFAYKVDGGLKSDSPNLKTLLHLFFGAAVHYAEHKRHSLDFTLSDVSDWLDEIGLEKLTDMITEGSSQYIPKNSNSLLENREKVAQ